MATESQEPATRPIYDAMRAAIADDWRSVCGVARASGVKPETIRRLLNGRRGTDFETADKAFASVGLAVICQADDLPRSLSAGLRAAIEGDGRKIYGLALAARVQYHAISQFLSGRRKLRLASAERLFVATGLKVVRVGGVERPGPTLPAQPLADALRSAIADDGRGSHSLARASDVYHKTITMFIADKWDINLTSTDKLYKIFGLAVIGPDGEARSPSEAIRAAIAGDGRKIYGLAAASGLRFQQVSFFAGGHTSLKLSSGDKLAGPLGLKVASVVKDGDNRPKQPVINPMQPFLAGLRSAIVDSGLSGYSLAKRSGVSTQTISRLLKGYDGLGYNTAIKLAASLGLRLEPARIEARIPETVASRPFPVELVGEGEPIILHGMDGTAQLPGIKGDAYTMLKRVVDDSKEGIKTPLAELKGLSDTKRCRPFWDALERPRLGPLKAIVLEVKEGRSKFVFIQSGEADRPA